MPRGLFLCVCFVFVFFSKLGFFVVFLNLINYLAHKFRSSSPCYSNRSKTKLEEPPETVQECLCNSAGTEKSTIEWEH